jgi:hypothetical protein
MQTTPARVEQALRRDRRIIQEESEVAEIQTSTDTMNRISDIIAKPLGHFLSIL